MNIIIRQESKEEYSKIETVIKEAFKDVEFSDQMEWRLVNSLRDTEEYIPELSLVAKVDLEVVGYIMYTNIKIVDGEKSHKAIALAPCAVLPEFQNKKIGRKLIIESLRRAESAGYELVVVLGHEHFYKKFGFKSSWLYNIKPPFDVPEDSYMVLELKKNALQKVSGVVEYSKAFME